LAAAAAFYVANVVTVVMKIKSQKSLTQRHKGTMIHNTDG